MLHRVSIAAPLLLAGVAGAQTPGFWLVGHHPSSPSSSVYGLSRNGHLAVGGQPAFSWTAATGREDWGLLPGMPPHVAPLAINSTGDTTAGRMDLIDGSIRAFRRIGAGLPQDLGVLPGETRAYALGISGDGATVVGTSEHTPMGKAYGEAFRWTEAGGMEGLGYLRPNGTYSRANAISRDGSTIVGWSQSGGPFGGPFEAFRWRDAEGMVLLPHLPGGNQWTEARAVNADGSVVVGDADAGGPNHAVRWVNGLVEDLGVAPGFTRSLAYAVDDSGDVIGGTSSSAFNFRACVWTPGTGMVLLSDYLVGHGIAPPVGWDLQFVNAVSGDGLTFAGRAYHPLTSHGEGFIATIPAPMTALVLACLPFCSPRRR